MSNYHVSEIPLVSIYRSKPIATAPASFIIHIGANFSLHPLYQAPETLAQEVPPPPSSRQHTSISITAHHLSYMHIIDQFFELSLLCIRRDAAEYTYTGSYRDARSTKHTIIVAFISNFIKLNRLYTT